MNGILSENDILSELFTHYSDWIQGLEPSTFSFLIRATYLFGVPFLLCTLTYDGENTRHTRQWFMLVVGVLLAFMLPVAMPLNPTLRTWLFTLALFAQVAMPAILPLMLVSTPPYQNRLRIAMYSTLGLLFLANEGGLLQ